MVMKRPSRLLVGRLLFIVALFATGGAFLFPQVRPLPRQE
jgi:hypothetical protein